MTLVYHNAGPLFPWAGKKPTWGQMYVLRPPGANSISGNQENQKCDRTLMKKLSSRIKKSFPYAKSYMMMQEIVELEERAALAFARPTKPVRMVFDINTENCSPRRMMQEYQAAMAIVTELQSTLVRNYRKSGTKSTTVRKTRPNR
uniref:Uncharacterized protein n=1 Tax=Caenorhabditis japonica TaxID=281687 RepID=A0A8R1EQ56_CAEJA